ncbi:MAG: hypothetical protein JRJ21_07290 [Deltaproteobacteria bacterium]|nr:hypothetical protein [Deltaproteobacteria bacterium]
MKNIFIENVEEEVLDWYGMSPTERFVESQKLWEIFVLLGGNYDPEPDTQSPFHIFEVQGSVAVDRGPGMHPLR